MTRAVIHVFALVLLTSAAVAHHGCSILGFAIVNDRGNILEIGAELAIPRPTKTTLTSSRC